MTSFARECMVYIGRAREFGPKDWLVYVLWIGTIFGLCASTGSFLLIGYTNGVHFPAEAWLVPIGAGMFTVAIAIDTIGHRTVYKQALADGESLVHGITIFLGVASVVCLVLAYSQPAFAIPAMVCTVLSFIYSLVDEIFHWRRYVTQKADRVEMSSHVLIMLGHGIMMTAWWWCYFLGYPGVSETLEFM